MLGGFVAGSPASAFAQGSSGNTGGSRAAQAVDGKLDLRGWDFETRGAALLNGTWLFFPGRLLSPAAVAGEPGAVPRRVPDLWRDGDGGGPDGTGAGTYVLRLTLPRGSGDLALRLRTVSTAYALFANGELIAAAGKPSVSSAEEIPAYTPTVAILPDSEHVELVIWVSNHQYRSGGLWRRIEIGTAAALSAAKRRNDLLLAGIAGFVVALSLSRLTFWLFRRSELSSLFLCLFSLLVAFRVLVTGEYDLVQLVPRISFDLLIRLEYSTAFLLVPAAALFFVSFFRDRFDVRFWAPLSLPSAAFFLLVPFAPLPILTRSILFYYPVAAGTIIALVAAVLLPAALKRRQGIWVALFGSLCLGIAGVNDMLYASFIVRTGNFLPLGLSLFVGAQAIVLARRFTATFTEAERLSADLAQANVELEAAFSRSDESRQELERTVADKETLLQEVHHRVKNSLQIVSSIISLQASRSREPAALDAYSKVRDRLRAISLVHERLYSLDAGEVVEVREYARELVEQLAASYGTGRGDVELQFDVERLEVPVSFALDVGLLLTEFVSNAFKHAILPRGAGRIEIQVKQVDRSLSIVVSDDGPGFPPGFQPETSRSLGFRVAASLIAKRGGHFLFGESTGTSIGASLSLR
ncbi:MAG TPA: histidine kinase dimerization/phosphoacceptor domain -containing protein [Rectinemataceae bacterium]|nr:histidine kinase dimerization/phosphoacceptor domain -containing protein [Rectinemataceae bacterium]